MLYRSLFHRSLLQRLSLSLFKRVFIPVTLVSSLLLSSGVTSETDIAATMHDRHENFEKIGESFKTIRDQLRASSPEMGKVDDAAKTIAALAAELPTWFPEGTGPESGIETEAKAEIWQQPVEFKSAAEKLQAESKKFAELTASGDAKAVMGGLRGLGGACKNCHDQFRVDDE